MTLNLPLPDSIQKFINEQVASGGYSNAAEYILHLIRQEQARALGVESLLLAGLDIAILAGVVNFLPHPNPPLTKGRE